MSENEQKTKTPPYTKLGGAPEQAVAAGVSQSMAFSVQNEVDAFRNQNTIRMVAMGTAYAKWLENPVMADQYRQLVSDARLDNDEQLYNNPITGKRANTGKTGAALASQVCSHFLSSPDSE